MMVFLLVLGIAVAFALGVVGYAGWRMGRLPVNHPAAVLARGGPPEDQPVLVCLGDSLTQGGLGADWVGHLRQRLGEEAFVVNAGVPAQVVWDLRQRLDEVARCRPAAIVLLVGSNDAVGALGGGWASFYERNRPQAPSEAWFTEQYDALVEELVALAPRLACLTLPPLGEDSKAQAEAIVRRHNDVIRASAARHGAELLDVHAALLALGKPTGASGVPFISGLSKFMAWSLGSTLRHHLLKQSWDEIARRRGLVLTADTIHPTDRAGDAMLDLLEPWAQLALSPGSTP